MGDTFSWTIVVRRRHLPGDHRHHRQHRTNQTPCHACPHIRVSKSPTSPALLYGVDIQYNSCQIKLRSSSRLGRYLVLRCGRRPVDMRNNVRGSEGSIAMAVAFEVSLRQYIKDIKPLPKLLFSNTNDFGESLAGLTAAACASGSLYIYIYIYSGRSTVHDLDPSLRLNPECAT